MSLYERALKIRQSVLEANHLDVALTSDNLAQLYEFYGREAEARSLSAQAQVIRKAQDL